MGSENAKLRVYDKLNSLQIPYDRMEHPAVFTMEEMEEAGISARGKICKNLFLRDAKGKKHFLVVVAGDKRVSLADLASRIGSTRLSFASAERLEKHLGLVQGEVSPLGILNDSAHQVTVYLDEELKSWEKLGVHPNDNTATIWITLTDLERLIREEGNPFSYIAIPVSEEL